MKYALFVFIDDTEKSLPSISKIIMQQSHVYDEESHLIGEYDANGIPLVEYVWLGDKPITAIYGNGTAIKIYNIVTDVQNTPRRLIDSSNHAVAWAWDSTAFGVGQAQGNIVFNLRFSGQYYDELTNQHYNHNHNR